MVIEQNTNLKLDGGKILNLKNLDESKITNIKNNNT